MSMSIASSSRPTPSSSIATQAGGRAALAADHPGTGAAPAPDARAAAWCAGGVLPARRLALWAAAAAFLVTLASAWARAPLARAAPAPGTTARASAGTEAEPPTPARAEARASDKKALSGKLNLNSASEEQLQQLPGIGPAKAERIVAWRGKNGGFKRVADLRKVKGFGFKTLKKLEPFLDVKGDNTLSGAR